MLHLHELVPELANPLQDLFLAVATTGLQSVRQFHYLQLEGRAEKRRSRETEERRGNGKKTGSGGEGWKEGEWDGGDRRGEERGLDKGKEKKEH